MRRSREEAAETRARILKVAGRQFRKHGIAGVGVADIMAKAELTHGGFYKHFASKEALAAEACRLALGRRRQELTDLAEAAPQGRGLEAILDTYLSPLHRDHVERGCVIAALVSEAPRQTAEVHHAIADGYEALARLVAAQLSSRVSERKRLDMGRGIVAQMLGALAAARLVSDREEAAAILASVRGMILASAER